MTLQESLLVFGVIGMAITLGYVVYSSTHHNSHKKHSAK